MRSPVFVTVIAVSTAALTLSGAAQELPVAPGAPAASFPKPDRPVAAIISPIYKDEKERG